jgi:hypothetical protein
MQKVLKDVPDDRVAAYVIWDPVFGGNFDSESKNLPKSFPDKRVQYFKDPDSLSGTLWKRVLKLFRPLAWDVYMLYGAQAQWDNDPPLPDFWMHQLDGLKIAPTLDEKVFTQELKAMVDRLEPKPAHQKPGQPTQGKVKMKIEIFYFDSCPSYKQAITNVKAALRETKIQADLQLIKVATEAKSEKVGFQGSPSIRINGKDIEGRDEGFSFGCRLYTVNGKPATVPSIEFIKGRLTTLK